MKHINRNVVLAHNASHGKWMVSLDCGHEFLCDHSVQEPGAVMACSKCEEEAEAEEDE